MLIALRRTTSLAIGLAAASLAFAPSIHAQAQTLASDGFDSGGFGAGVVRFSGVNDQFAVFAGARGGWIINHTFILGGAGYGLANDISIIPDASGRDFDFGYGGLELTYVYASDLLIHGTFSALIGGGSITRFDFSDGVFVFEPSGNVVVNITSYFRIAGGGGYRFVSGVDSFGLTNGDFSMLFGELVLKFGSF
jgi:hypothetical protein